MFSILVNNKEINNFSIQLEIDKFIQDKVSSEVFYELDKWLKSFQAEIGKHKPELTRWVKYRRKLNIKKLGKKKKRP